MNLKGAIRFERNQALFYSLVVGTAMFIYVTGGAIINPTNRDWLMFGDAATHYFGWEFFRNTPLFQWPIGANYPLGMELSSSIVFTDSIPVAAYVAKLFNPILPATFQYLGIWIWLCFVLQAFFAQRFLKFFVSNRTSVYLGACFVVLSPPLVYRLIHAGSGHIALASHWLILASFCLYLQPGRNDAKWSVLFALCWLVHAYFSPMIAAVWLASLVRRSYFDNERLSVVKSFMIIMTTSLFIMWASGYFIIGSNFNPAGWNYVFRWEPLSLVDSGTATSTGWSRILPNRTQTDGTTEAFSFLGVSVMVMMTTSMTGMISVKMLRHRRLCAFTVFVAVMFVYLVVNLLSTDRALSFLSLFMIVAFGFTVVHRIFLDRQRMKTFSPLVIVTASLALYSMTNRIGLGQQTLFEFPLFPPLKQFTETFRTHGRFIWPIYYLAVFSAIIFFVRTTSRKYLPYAIIALLLFQIYDSSNASNLTRQRFTKSPQWSSPLKDSRWGMFAERYDHVVFVPPLNNDPDEIWIAIDELASKYQLSTNSGYFSRYDPSKFVSMTEKYITQINSDQMDDQTIYVLDPKFFPKVYHIPEDMENSIKIMDGFFVITP